MRYSASGTQWTRLTSRSGNPLEATVEQPPWSKAAWPARRLASKDYCLHSRGAGTGRRRIAGDEEVMQRFGYARSTVLSVLFGDLRRHDLVGRRGEDGRYRLEVIE
jgi:hypothetical protein